MEYGTILLPCNFDGCQKLVTLKYDPGVPMTRWYPGEPATWYVDGPYEFGDHVHDAPNSNLFYVWLDEICDRADFVNSQSWDNYYDY